MAENSVRGSECARPKHGAAGGYPPGEQKELLARPLMEALRASGQDDIASKANHLLEEDNKDILQMIEEPARLLKKVAELVIEVEDEEFSDWEEGNLGMVVDVKDRAVEEAIEKQGGPGKR